MYSSMSASHARLCSRVVEVGEVRVGALGAFSLVRLLPAAGMGMRRTLNAVLQSTLGPARYVGSVHNSSMRIVMFGPCLSTCSWVCVVLRMVSGG